MSASYAATRSRRASNKGILEMSLGEYLLLLDWTARQIRTDKRGATPKELAPIFERLQISAELWIESVLNFRKWCRSAVVVPGTTPGRNDRNDSRSTKRVAGQNSSRRTQA